VSRAWSAFLHPPSQVSERECAPVEERRSARRNLLRSQVLVKHHRGIGHRPGKVDVLAEPLWGGDSVLESALIKHVGGELGEARVHPVLNLKTYWPIAKDNETFKEGLRETRPGGLLVHDDGAELLVISNENGLLAAEDERNHAFCKAAKIAQWRLEVI
jgi:hypothetical protein